MGLGLVIVAATFWPVTLFLFAGIGVALGVVGGAAILMVDGAFGRRVAWLGGGVIVALAASLTVLPIAKYEIAQRQAEKHRNIRANAIVRADFKGTLAGHPVAFPASPRLYLSEDCGSLGTNCSTNLTNPVTSFTQPDDVLLHERTDPVNFRIISVSVVEPYCRLGDNCLTQTKINRWCNEIRPDQADSIWCEDFPPMGFSFRTDATRDPSDREEPELAARYVDTPLGSGQVQCFYHTDKSKI